MSFRLEHALGLLEDSCLSNEGIVEVASQMESAADRQVFLAAGLKAIITTARAEGAHDALELMPPMLSGMRPYGDTYRFTELLFPFKPGYGLKGPDDPPTDFWVWQQQLATSMESQQAPARLPARRKWLALCERDPEWTQAIATLAECYYDFAVLAREGGEIRYTPRGYGARMGKPDCGHVAVVERCDYCISRKLDAREAHLGWVARWRWEPFRGPFGPDAQMRAEMENCACCGNGHDTRPRGVPRCVLCAEALLNTTKECLSRRWGGWLWLEQHLRTAAVHAAREAHSDLLGIEASAGLYWEPHESVIETWAEIQRFGVNPWHADRSREMDVGADDPIGTLLLPVAILATDLKSDVRDRALALLDRVWDKAGVREPKSRAVTPRRSEQWDRYLDWLWQHRVEGVPLEELENTSSPVDPTVDVLPKNVRRGLELAIETLG